MDPNVPAVKGQPRVAVFPRAVTPCNLIALVVRVCCMSQFALQNPDEPTCITARTKSVLPLSKSALYNYSRQCSFTGVFPDVIHHPIAL